MANEPPLHDPKRGYRIELDKPRYLRMTLGAMRRLEEVSGFRYNSPEFAEWAESLDGITGMIWAELLHEDPDLTLERARELVDVAIPWQIQQALQGATQLAMVPPSAGGNGTAAPPLAPAPPDHGPSPTGMTSGVLGSTTSDAAPVSSGS